MNYRDNTNSFPGFCLNWRGKVCYTNKVKERVPARFTAGRTNLAEKGCGASMEGRSRHREQKDCCHERSAAEPSSGAPAPAA